MSFTADGAQLLMVRCQQEGFTIGGFHGNVANVALNEHQ